MIAGEKTGALEGLRLIQIKRKQKEIENFKFQVLIFQTLKDQPFEKKFDF